MSAPQLTLQSITGVDVQLRIAGPGSRSYAFVLDWHFRLLIALAWWIAASFAYFGRFILFEDSGSSSLSYDLGVIAPALAIYFFYHPVLEIVMHGRTPGKRIAGVRIVTRTGDIPGVGALLLRNVFRLVDALPAFYLIGLIVTMFTAQHVRIGDLAAGTLLIIDDAEAETSFASLGAAGSGKLDPRTAELIQELLDRWKELDPVPRRKLAQSLVARVEPQLDNVRILDLGDDSLHAKLAAAVKPQAA
jgi:uncharacterized RDD family membrane protein YckC